MRTIQLHPVSLAVGAAVALFALAAMGQHPVPPGSIHAVSAPQSQEVIVDFLPHPRDYVQIKEGETYVVPSGRIFVLTGLGGNIATTGGASLLVDGQVEVVASVYSTTENSAASVRSVPLGFSVPGGASIAVVGAYTVPDDARAWGYLVDD